MFSVNTTLYDLTYDSETRPTKEQKYKKEDKEKD